MPPRKHRHIKYRAKLIPEGVEVTILEQTHRGRSFIPRGDQFNLDDKTFIGSWHYPYMYYRVDGLTVQVGLRGSGSYGDHRKIYFNDTNKYARFKQCILAYNEKYKVEPKV